MGLLDRKRLVPILKDCFQEEDGKSLICFRQKKDFRFFALFCLPRQAGQHGIRIALTQRGLPFCCKSGAERKMFQAASLLAAHLPVR